MNELSIHDNRVVGYEVDGNTRRIVLHTQGTNVAPNEWIDVVFDGVVAYLLEGDNFGNLLLDIEDVPISDLVERNRRQFEEGAAFAWPGSWNTSPEVSIRHFEAAGAKAFAIDSDYGLSGWVVAASCRLLNRP